MIITIAFTISVVVLIFIKQKNPEEVVINKYYIIAAVSLVYLIINLLRSMRSPYYFEFDDTTDVLILRNYPISLFNSKKNSFEIPKQHFVKYEIKKYFFGLEEKLIVYQLYRNKVAKYPPIPLSAVNREDRKKVKAALDQYSRKK
jgi:hypothetical protein